MSGISSGDTDKAAFSKVALLYRDTCIGPKISLATTNSTCSVIEIDNENYKSACRHS